MPAFSVLLLISVFLFYRNVQLATPALVSNVDLNHRLSSASRIGGKCRRRPFRTLSGRCTSEGSPSFGRVGSPYFSAIPNQSSVLATGLGLRSAREISNILSEQTSASTNSHRLNEFWPYFAQFFAHDLVQTPGSSEQLPIVVPPDDPFIPPGVPISFQRVARVRTGEGDNERAVNIVSSALDLSPVYGVDSKRNKAVREPGSAKLRTGPGNVLPLNTAGLPNEPTPSSDYYLTGDTRSNEGPTLLALHTIFLREHNRLVDEIRAKLPFLSKRKLYEFARKINIAQYQKVVFEEYCNAFIPLPLPQYRGHRPEVDLTTSDVFIGASFGSGPNLLGKIVQRRGPRGRKLPGVPLADSLFRNATENPMTSAEIDNFIRGSISTIAQENDLQLEDALRNILIMSPFGRTALDLAAVSIQRTRDLALPSYNGIRKLFKLKPLPIDKISSSAQVVAGLKAAYDGKVEDVDSWVGLLAEDKILGGNVGITVARSWRSEFIRLRDGDQFFYKRRSKMPLILRRKLRNRLSDIYNEKKRLMREIILRNTGVSRRDLPKGDIFKV